MEISCVKYLQPVETMPRITRQEFCDRFDEVMESVERENIGYVITDPRGGKDVILCPAHWFEYCADEDFGCIVNSALRYAINRRTYMPDTVIRFIRRQMNILDVRTISVAIRDIEEELEYGDVQNPSAWRHLKEDLEVRLKELNTLSGTK